VRIINFRIIIIIIIINGELLPVLVTSLYHTDQAQCHSSAYPKLLS